MKVRFFRFAAALLAGAALLATGCTDFGADIKSVEEKYADLPGRVASLEQQLQGLQTTLSTTYETIANHEADMEGLRNDITALLDAKLDKSTFEAFQASVAAAQEIIAGLKYADKDFVSQVAALLKDLAALTEGDWTAAGVQYAAVQEYIDGEIARLENRLAKVEKAIEDLTKEGGIIDQIKKSIEDLQSGKIDKTDFDAYKEVTAQTLGLMQSAIQDLLALTAGFPEGSTIKEYIDAIAAKLDDYVLKTTFEEFVAIVGTKEELEGFESTIIGRLKGLEKLTAGFPEDQTVKEYIDGEIIKIQGQLDQITNEDGTGRLDLLEKAFSDLEKLVKEIILPQIQFAITYEGGLQAYIDDGDAWALREAKKYTDNQISLVMDVLNEVYSFAQSIQNRVQSVVLVPAFEDGKMSLVASGSEVNTFKIMPADAAQAVVEAFAKDPDAFSFDVKTVATRAGGDDAALKLSVTDIQLNAANADKGWVDVSVSSNFKDLSSSEKALTYNAALVINIQASENEAGASISSPFYGIFVDKSIGKLKLTPHKDIIIPWDYMYYKDIKDTLIDKIWVDGSRDKLIGVDASKTWNADTETDYTDGTGAVTGHTNDSAAIDLVLVSKAEYGTSDSTYVYSIQKYDSVEGITYYGEFNYVVRARPADAVIYLDPVDAKVGDTKVAVDAITALYDFHKKHYSRYSIADVAPDFINTVTIDSKKVTFDGASTGGALGCHFGYDSGVEKTYFSVDLNKAGAWELYVYTHFVGVGYTFVIPINVE